MEIIFEEERPLMARKEVCVKINFEGPTPTRQKIRKQVADKFKAKEELVFIQKIDTSFGFRNATVTANIYKKKEDVKEPKYILDRLEKKPKEKPKAAEKVEAPAEEAKPKDAPKDGAEDKADKSKEKPKEEKAPVKTEEKAEKKEEQKQDPKKESPKAEKPKEEPKQKATEEVKKDG